jgi:hypothetical protein
LPLALLAPNMEQVIEYAQEKNIGYNDRNVLVASESFRIMFEQRIAEFISRLAS